MDIKCPMCEKVLASFSENQQVVIHGNFMDSSRPKLVDYVVHGSVRKLLGEANVSSIFCDSCKKYYSPLEKEWESFLECDFIQPSEKIIMFQNGQFIDMQEPMEKPSYHTTAYFPKLEEDISKRRRHKQSRFEEDDDHYFVKHTRTSNYGNPYFHQEKLHAYILDDKNVPGDATPLADLWEML